MPSLIDKFYKEIFGDKSLKRGAAFEKLSCLVSKIINPENTVLHDQRMRGITSKTNYQIDVKLENAGKTKIGEAKDYTYSKKENKVGRGNIQKLAGALPDLDVDSGIFFSATGYTKDAHKYAAVSEDITGKPISLYQIRPSTEKDEEGRIRSFIINLQRITPDYQKLNYVPILSETGKIKLAELQSQNKTLIFSAENLYDSNGEIKISIADITKYGFELMGENNFDDGSGGIVHGCFYLPKHYFKLENELLEINGFEFIIPYIINQSAFKFSQCGEFVLRVTNADCSFDKLITDEQLKQFHFLKDGSLIS